MEHIFDKPEWYFRRSECNIRIRAETVKEFVCGRGLHNILDIGCGDGTLSLPLLDGQKRLTLVDRSSAMLMAARANTPGEFSSHVTFVNQDFTEARLAEKSFDLVLCVGVLAFVNERNPFIEKIRTLMVGGGMLVLECTDGSHPVSYLVRSFRAVQRAFIPSTVRTVIWPSSRVVTMCEGLGLEYCRTFRYSLPLPIVNRLVRGTAAYKAIRRMFGSAAKNRNAWLGNECIHCFTNGKAAPLNAMLSGKSQHEKRLAGEGEVLA